MTTIARLRRLLPARNRVGKSFTTTLHAALPRSYGNAVAIRTILFFQLNSVLEAGFTVQRSQAISSYSKGPAMKGRPITAACFLGILFCFFIGPTVRAEEPSDLEAAIIRSRNAIHSLRATYTVSSKSADGTPVSNKYSIYYSNGRKRWTLLDHVTPSDEVQANGIRIVNYPSPSQEKVVGTIENLTKPAKYDEIPDFRLIGIPTTPLILQLRSPDFTKFGKSSGTRTTTAKKSASGEDAVEVKWKTSQGSEVEALFSGPENKNLIEYKSINPQYGTSFKMLASYVDVPGSGFQLPGRVVSTVSMGEKVLSESEEKIEYDAVNEAMPDNLFELSGMSIKKGRIFYDYRTKDPFRAIWDGTSLKPLRVGANKKTTIQSSGFSFGGVSTLYYLAMALLGVAIIIVFLRRRSVQLRGGVVVSKR